MLADALTLWEEEEGRARGIFSCEPYQNRGGNTESKFEGAPSCSCSTEKSDQKVEKNYLDHVIFTIFMSFLSKCLTSMIWMKTFLYSFKKGPIFGRKGLC